MTDVRKDDKTLIHSIEDVLPLYAGNNLPPAHQTIGMETEISLFKFDADGNPVGASAKDCADLQALLVARGHTAQLEMASAIEYASNPHRVGDIAVLMAEIKDSWQAFRQAIAERGLVDFDGAQLPFATLESAKANLVDRDRARGLVEGMGRFKPEEFLKVTLLCTSTQVSLSYSDSNDLYRLLTTGYALSPVLFGLFANHAPVIENGKDATAGHPRGQWYGAFGDVGGIPESLLSAKNGDDFIRLHCAQVFTTDMLFYYDAAGEIVWPEKPLSFSALAEKGLNTKSNYDLAETFIYHDIKVCNLRDENGIATGKRIELRALDAGSLGVFSGVPALVALLRDEQTFAALSGLLDSYGMTPAHEDFAQNLLASRAAAVNHDGRYLDVAFGNGNLRDFCRDLADILDLHASRHPEMAEYLSPAINVAKKGQPPAQQTALSAKAVAPQKPSSARRHG